MVQQSLNKINSVSLRVVFCLVILLTAAGCSQEKASKEQARDESGRETMTPVPGGMVVVALSGDPDVLNPLTRRSSEGGQIIAEILDTLTEIEVGLVHAPRIAESWQLAPDSLSITYHLRPWVWEDGHPLTAYDVAESFRLFKNPDVASHRRGYFSKVNSAEVIDEATIRYHFTNILPDPLSRSQHGILPLHIVSQLNPGDVNTWALNQKPMSSGPFRMVSWEHSREIILQRNDNYPLKKTFLDRVSFRIMGEAATRVLGLQTGEVDFVANVSAHDAERLKDRDDLQIFSTEGRRYYYLLWNCRNPRFADATTRRALSMAIDRQRMNQTLLGGFANPAVGPIAQVLWNFNRDLQADPYDPKAASAMLAEAGWKDENGDGILERDGLALDFEILTKQGDPVRTNGVVILRENLNAVGVGISVRSMELAAGLDLLRQGEFDSYFGSWKASLFGDPSNQVHSEAIDEFNNGFYSNTEVDSLLSAAISQQDRSLAKPIWYRLQVLLQQDPPAAYLLCPQRLDVVSRRIQNVRPDILSPFNNMSQWWIAPADRKYNTGNTGE